MAGLIFWKKAIVPVANPDVDHALVGIDVSDSMLYVKNDAGTVTKFPTLSQILSTVLSGLSIVLDSPPISSSDTILSAMGKIQGQLSVRKEKKLSVPVVNSSNVTLSNLTEFDIQVTAGKSYLIETTILYSSAATATGIVLTMGNSLALGTLSLAVNIPVAADGTASFFNGCVTSFGDAVIGTGTPLLATSFVARIKGIFVCTTSGVITPQFRSEINASAVTVQAGSVSVSREF